MDQTYLCHDHFMQENASLHIGGGDGDHEDESAYHESLSPGLHDQDVGIGRAVSSS
jgi:hypothetical protein